MIVLVVVEGNEAMIVHENKAILRVPAEQVRRRMGTEKLAQFHAHLVHGWLEIDERVPFAGGGPA